MVIWLYCIFSNEAEMLPFFLQHYAPQVDRLIMLDNGSTDNSRALIAAYPNATIEKYPTDCAVMDSVNMAHFASTRYHEARGYADFVLWVDCDEFLWAGGQSLRGVLRRYRQQGIRAVRSVGYQMLSDSFPTGTMPITEQIRYGIRDAEYDKVAIFDPELSIRFRPGRGDSASARAGGEMNVTAFKALTDFIYELKYSEDQPRDDSGRWSDTGGGNGDSGGSGNSEGDRSDGSGSSVGIFSNYDQMDSVQFGKSLEKMAAQVAPEVQFKPLEDSNLTYTTSRGKTIKWPSYDEYTDTVYGAEQGKLTASHEFSHAITRGSQTTDWVYSAEDIDGIGKVLSENRKYHGEHYTLGKHEQRDGGMSNPRNYNWQELGTELTADYIRGKLDSRLKPLLEDVSNKIPNGRLKRLLDYNR